MTIKAKIKTGDQVYVLAGKDKGQTAKVEKVFAEDAKILVENVNMAKKHLKPKNKQGGGIISVNKPLAISNVQLVCPACKKRTRITFEGTGKNKQRVCKQCSVTIDEIKKETPKTKKK